MSKAKEVHEFRPEMAWIQNPDMRENTPQSWMRAIDCSPFHAQHVRELPWNLQVEDWKVSFLAQNWLATQLAPESALKREPFMGDDKPVDQDLLNAKVIRADMDKPFVKGLGF